MKLAVLLGLAVPTIRSALLTYPTDIGSFDFSWSNPDQSTDVETGPTDGTLLTDGDASIGGGEILTNPVRGTWGDIGASTTVGMDGSFQAATLNLNTGYSFWMVSSAEVVFDAGGGCFSSDTTVSAYYYDFATSTRTILTVTTTSDANDIWTFSADIATSIKTNGYIGFDVTTSTPCEGDIGILEFSIDGVMTATDEPTRSPTKTPTQTPTTATPTMAPTSQCKGVVTWGDPHFQLVAHSTSHAPAQLNFQGLGWFYYIMPCDLGEYENWPFFLLSHHARCWWQGNPKGCIDNNRLVLNTRPDPWIIEFTNNNLDITVGTDTAGQSASDFDTNNFQNYRESNPITIDYNDGSGQYGNVLIWYKSGNIVLNINDVAYSVCEGGHVMELKNRYDTTAFSCPTCLRNVACGLMGKYTRGDCNKWMVADPNHECYNILLGSDGQTYTPPTSDAIFETFALTWGQDTVETRLENDFGFSVPDYLRSHEASTAISPVMEGRIRGLEIEDASYYDGECENNMDQIKAVNETCRQNIVVQYAECCAEIGICDTLWKGCIEDMCSCTDNDGSFTDEQCLNSIVHQSMNLTCNLEWLYPTATPTGAPTSSPTEEGFVASLPFGDSTEEFVAYMAGFVLLFVLIALAAFCYYKKKTGKGVHSFEDGVEMKQGATTSGYGQTDNHTAAV